MIGRVISTKNKNTATVLIERTVTHPLYRKTFIRSKRFSVDDQIGVEEGQIVEITQSKPISKRKTWQITKVLGRSLAEIAEEQMKEKAAEVIAEVMPEKPEVSGSEKQAADTSDSSEQSGIPSNSESSEKKKARKKKETK